MSGEMTYTVDGEVMSPLEYIGWLTDEITEVKRKALEMSSEARACIVDAERYRWLRNPKRSHAAVGFIIDNTGKASHISEYSLDRAIDSSREIQPQEKS